MRDSVAPMRIVIFGLSITSSWGNGHATTYRALVRGLARLGHHVSFFERQQPWYAAHRDLPNPEFCTVTLYDNVAALDAHFGGSIPADLVIIGSYVPQGVSLAQWVLNHTHCPVAFYDIDTPVTLARLDRGHCTYLEPPLIPEFDLYLSFTGGPILQQLRRVYGARYVLPFYCSVDKEHYFPVETEQRYDLAYLGTYSADRQPKLEMLLNETARCWPQGRFCVAGAQYPDTLEWPANVTRIEHLAPSDHRQFYNEQRFALNVTRADMVTSGYSPSVRLFEAAACGVPIISDEWAGLGEFFTPEKEILIARSAAEALRYVRDLPATEARAIGARARQRVLEHHTGDHRARQLEACMRELGATPAFTAKIRYAT
jgi:spore maturation protein CgeB